MNEKIATTLTQYIERYGLRIAIALVVLWVGFTLINFLSKIIEKQLKNRKIDASLNGFLVNIANWTLKILLIVSIASMLGFETASFVALIGALGLALGLALQGSLQNFAGGILILLNKPYKVNDWVEIQGEKGVVKSIEIFSTILETAENKTIILPNALVSNGKITNFSRLGTLRLDIHFNLAPTQDFRKAQELLLNVMLKHSAVLESPAPFVGIVAILPQSTKIVAQAYVQVKNYHDLSFDLYALGRKALVDGQIQFGQAE
jgi:small conductance mechanosensitive channel